MRQILTSDFLSKGQKIMDMTKKAYKKLTNANGLVRLFSIISLVLGVIAVLLEPCSRLLYNMIFTNKVDYILVNTFKSYINATQHSYILLAATVALMIAAFSSKNKKNIGQGFSSLMVLIPIITAVQPTISMFDYLDSQTFKYYMDGADNLKFKGLVILCVYLLVLIVALLLVISGLVLLIKASGEKPTEVTYVESGRNKPQQMGFNPQQNQFNQFGAPQNGFGNPNMPNAFANPNTQGFNGNNNTIGGFGAAPFGAPKTDPNTQSMFSAPKPEPVTSGGSIADDLLKRDTTVPAAEPAPAEITTAPAEKTQDGTGLTKVCSECGTVLNENAKFCKGCGKPV